MPGCAQSKAGQHDNGRTRVLPKESTRPCAWRESSQDSAVNHLRSRDERTRAYAAWLDKRNCGVLGPDCREADVTAVSKSLMLMFEGVLAGAETNKARSVEKKKRVTLDFQ